MEVPEKAKKALETAVKVGAYAALGSAGSALAWIAVSSLLIDHRRGLKSAMGDLEPQRTRGGAGDLAFYADRSGEGRPLLLIHSVNAAASAIEMRPLFERFRGVRPVFALDLPGFGFSARPDRRYSPELYSRAISAFIENEIGGKQPVDVVALSLGCEFAALSALDSPQLFSSLAMISPTGFGQRAMPYSDFRRKSLSVPLWSQAFHDLLTTRASLRYYLSKSFRHIRVPAELIEYAFATSHQAGARFAPLYFLGGHLFTQDVRSQVYSSLRIPVHVLYDQDAFADFDHLEDFLRDNHKWSAVRIPETNGMPQWEKPEETLEELRHFWNEASARRSVS